jgi:hypothetical protein
MPFLLFVSDPKLTDADAVRTILSEYFSTVEWEVKQSDKPGEYRLVGCRWEAGPAESYDHEWPQAAREELFDGEAPDLDAFANAVLSAHGDDGFLELLRKLSPTWHRH